MKRPQIFIFLLIIFGILLLVHLVVYEAILVIFPELSAKIAILKIFSVLLPLLFIGSNALAFWFNNYFTRIFYRFMAVWIGLVLYLFLASVLLGIGSFFLQMQLAHLGEILFVVAVFVTLYGLIHSQQIKIVPVTIKLKNLPENWENRSFVFVSDWHLGQIRGQRFAARVVDKINQLKPEAVFIGGDLYDGVMADNLKIIGPLKNLQTKLGIYFVTGNHDGFTDKSTKEDVATINKIGIKVLKDELVTINGLSFIGVDYKNTINRENFAEILSQMHINRSEPSILIKHVPDNIDIAAGAGISLQISGHTHRAQVWPLRFIPKLIYKGFDYGLKKSGLMQVYISSGVGTWGPPLRVGTNSEIALITVMSPNA